MKVTAKDQLVTQSAALVSINLHARKTQQICKANCNTHIVTNSIQKKAQCYLTIRIRWAQVALRLFSPKKMRKVQKKYITEEHIRYTTYRAPTKISELRRERKKKTDRKRHRICIETIPYMNFKRSEKILKTKFSPEIG